MTDEQLRRLEQRMDTIDEKLDQVRAEDLPAIRVDIAGLKIKAGIWGAAAGLLGSLAAVILALAAR
jgi:tetrahydromethanopterin S-methyltransferase subunit G